MTAIQLWGGVEYTVNRVGDRYVDQLARSGHAERIDDLDAFATCGFRALRYPVLWEHVAPANPAERRWEWADGRLERMRALGLRPIVGLLHHGSGPGYTSLVDPGFPELFAEYARAVAERYPWVQEWTPINEPLTTARFSGLYGHWFPHGRSDTVFLRALINQLRATVLAMREIRQVNPSARLVQTEDAGQSFGTAHLQRQVRHERERRWLTWDLLAGRVADGHPLTPFLLANGVSKADLAFFRDTPCAPDVLGLNYYLTSDRWLDERLSKYPFDYHGGNGRIQYADLEAVRARPEGIVGHEQHLVEAWQRYGIPVAITEVHVGCTRDEQMRWFVEAWNGAAAAAARGAHVEAVTAWALLGSFDWDSLVTVDRGHYEPGLFDIRGPAPRATALANLVRTIAAGETPSHPIVRGPGWWRRPERLTFSEVAASPIDSAAVAPLLIVGARGTLGSAFQRICAQRGLPTHAVTRTEMDMSDPARVDAVLRRVRPWAVVNAAGYVRVDAAEADRAGCWRDNVTGPVTLAAACRRRGVPLTTFSSDLVFDGAVTRPYVESNAVAPLNAYGAAKAEAEQRVLDLLPDALVVRTSAFFGPWDDYNFATQLLRAVLNETPFRAADDAIVSPTYLPDLVHAVLDLLIDGERGIWHLANTGAVSWLAFGRAIAERAGADPSLVVPCSWSDIWQPAARPSYSALGSERGALLRPIDDAIEAYAGATAVRLAAGATRCASS
jgi:dTDP-4-dehydrorhamnose reductase